MADTRTLKRYFLSGQHCPTTLTTEPRRRSLLGTVFVALAAELLHLVLQKSDCNQPADLGRQVVQTLFQ
jgi:hypothetical protein